MFITFLTDFGLQDDYVGTCHGVIKRIAPDAHVIDITHGIQPQRVLQGALTLAASLPYMPVGVHLAVVDPGVGTERRAVALRGSDGRLYVGPDNGLLALAADELGGVTAAHELTNDAFRLEPVSATFHGRDVFAPAAAHLALGVALEQFGPAIDANTLVRLDVPAPEIRDSSIDARVLDIDRFGNVQLNLRSEHLERAGISPGTEVEVEAHGERYFAAAARTYLERRPGDILLYEDSHGAISVAISEGNAAELVALSPGDRVVVHVRRA